MAAPLDFLRSGRVLRVIPAAALILLLVWLAQSDSRYERRFNMLTTLARAGRLGSNSAEERAQFETLVRSAVAIAGITDAPIINGEPVRGQLHFYLTDPAVSEFTRCEAGNAIFDPQLDTVFVDRSLFEPTELPRVGQALMWEQWAPHTFPFSGTFTQLILLHELGHRQRPAPRGWFDVWRRPIIDDERDADRFAIERFRAAVVRGDLTIGDDVLAEVREAGVDPSLAREQQLVAALLYATSQMSIGLLFTKGAFSSLTADATHPSYGTRVQGMSKAVLELAAGDPSLTKYLDYFGAVSARVEALRSLPFVEIYGTGAINAAALIDDGVAVVDRDWRLWTTALPARQETDAPTRIAARAVAQLPDVRSPALVDMMWSTGGQGVFVSTGSMVLQHAAGALRKRPDLAAILLSAGTGIPIRTIQPSPSVGIDAGSRVVVVDSNGTMRTIERSDLLASARRHGVRDPTVRSMTLMGGELRLAIHESHGALKGALIYPFENSAAVRFVSLMMSDEVDSYGELAIVDDPDGQLYLLVGKVDLDSDVFIWELFGDRPPAQRIRYSPLRRRLAGMPLSGQNVPTVVTHVRVAGPDRVIISLAADSVLSYNVRTGTLTPVFHPSTGINVNVGRGRLMFSAFNAHKLFVLPD